jgi:hypothetical protein
MPPRSFFRILFHRENESHRLSLSASSGTHGALVRQVIRIGSFEGAHGGLWIHHRPGSPRPRDRRSASVGHTGLILL